MKPERRVSSIEVPVEELETRLHETQDELATLRFQLATRKLSNYGAGSRRLRTGYRPAQVRLVDAKRSAS